MSSKPVALYYSILKYQPQNRRRLKAECEVLQRVDVLFAPLGYHVGPDVIDACPRLKVIASNTTGHPHIDVAYARLKGIAIACLKFAPDFLRLITPTAELAWGLIIALTRNIVPAHRAVLSGQWDRRPFGAPAMLSNMSLGVIGHGRLGRMVASYGKAFGMKKIGFFDPYVEFSDVGAKRFGSLEGLVSAHDIVSVHVHHEPETEGMFNHDIFREFKKGAYFINTARGELVDWDSLLEVLSSGHLAGAALDVFEGEIEIGFQNGFVSHPLLQYAREHDNLVITPHIGGSTLDAWSQTEAYTIRHDRRSPRKRP